jgi:hypothetical protein
LTVISFSYKREDHEQLVREAARGRLQNIKTILTKSVHVSLYGLFEMVLLCGLIASLFSKR